MALIISLPDWVLSGGLKVKSPLWLLPNGLSCVTGICGTGICESSELVRPKKIGNKSKIQYKD